MSAAQRQAWDAEAALRDRLTTDLPPAMRARDATAIAAIRTVIAALDNAGAVALSGPEAPAKGQSGDVPRRDLSPDDIQAILAREIAERRAAMTDYEAGGRPDAADRLRAEVAIIASYADTGFADPARR